MSKLAGDGQVRVEVFDARGRLVRVVHDGPFVAGTHALARDGRDGPRAGSRRQESR